MQFLRSTFGLAALGGLLFWIALPPLDLGLLAWFAPIPWVLLIEREQLTGKRPYLQIGIAYFFFWLAALHWLTLPHWATSFGLIALAFYLSWYLPLFVGLTRIAVHQLRLPVALAAPVVWVGLEFVQSWFLTGFTMVMLGQTQYRWITLIQVVDLTGTFGLSFLIVLFAASVVRIWQRPPRMVIVAHAVAVSMAVSLTIVYGVWRMQGDYLSEGPTVALIQGDIDTELKADPTKNEQIFREYGRLTMEATNKEPKLDLIVWPETMFRYAWFTFADNYKSETKSSFTPENLVAASRQAVRNVVLPIGVPMLLGVDRWHHTAAGMERFNSALFFDELAEPLGYYAKNHLVMFGEYVPFAKQFPFLLKLTPLGSSSEGGSEGVAVKVRGVCYSPSICFETTLSRVIRRLVNEAKASEKSCDPQVLVNLTNDGWFWGSAELDMHLICGVFRAVECRKPLLVAANTGFSAWIDSDGRIVKQGKRRQEDVIIARPQLDRRQSPYLQWGDWFAGTCAACVAGVAAWGIVRRRAPITPKPG